MSLLLVGGLQSTDVGDPGPFLHVRLRPRGARLNGDGSHMSIPNSVPTSNYSWKALPT